MIMESEEQFFSEEALRLLEPSNNQDVGLTIDPQLLTLNASNFDTQGESYLREAFDLQNLSVNGFGLYPDQHGVMFDGLSTGADGGDSMSQADCPKDQSLNGSNAMTELDPAYVNNQGQIGFDTTFHPEDLFDHGLSTIPDTYRPMSCGPSVGIDGGNSMSQLDRYMDQPMDRSNEMSELASIPHPEGQPIIDLHYRIGTKHGEPQQNPHIPGRTVLDFTNTKGRKRKRAKFNEESRQKVADVRKKGACLRCRILKIPVCSHGLNTVSSSTDANETVLW